MAEVDINLIAVFIATIVNFIAIGMFWYSPKLFGNAWIRLNGFSKAQVKKMKSEGMGKKMAIGFLASLLMMYVLAHVVDYMTAGDSIGGAAAGSWMWLGFVGPVMLGIVLWEGKSWKLWMINSGYWLVSLVVGGAIIGAFK